MVMVSLAAFPGEHEQEARVRSAGAPLQHGVQQPQAPRPRPATRARPKLASRMKYHRAI